MNTLLKNLNVKELTKKESVNTNGGFFGLPPLPPTPIITIRGLFSNQVSVADLSLLEYLFKR